MRLKLLSAAVAAVAVLAVGVASASATTMQYWDSVPATPTWTNFAVNQNVDVINSGSITLATDALTVTCTSSLMNWDQDADGTIDVGDVKSVTYGGCSSNFFGLLLSATLDACQVENATGEFLTRTTIELYGTCVDLNVGGGSCVMRIEGSLTGGFTNGAASTAGRATLAFSGAGGLAITSALGFMCQSSAPGDPANFTGTFKLSTKDAASPTPNTTSVRSIV